LDKFAEFVRAQGGDDSSVYNTDKFPKASIIEEVKAPSDGYVASIITDEIGMTSLVLGGGRETKDSEIDLAVGIEIVKKIGDKINKGDTLAVLYGNIPEKVQAARQRLLGAYVIGSQQVEPVKYIYGIVTRDGLKLF
jgi:pyrimidine-nucleoside phosphorylase